MKVDKKLVEYLANLSRLEFDDTKLDEITGQLKGIIKYVEKLDTLDTKDVEPTAHILPLKNVFREDKIIPSIDRDKIFKSSPDSDNGYFIVPKVIEE
ncbi:Asp-tRNA(Asn)/Glu-tRNA(Gln) amidotransferase subunit GatC [bacterium]|jgi:aspartyl-tRNA(Asn)/glutamyl-tRNA(Gln) amidotransferase subunit C|nr:Asp-tRNA(Asn)/Glu-tRNA(Gln) amidotransferase subunit GatC [bacterium]